MNASSTHRDRHIDTNLTGLNVTLEAASSGTGVCEDGSAVAVLVLVDEVYGVLEGGDVDTDEDGTENFFGVALHVRLDVGYESWADLGKTEVSTWRKTNPDLI